MLSTQCSSLVSSVQECFTVSLCLHCTAINMLRRWLLAFGSGLCCGHGHGYKLRVNNLISALRGLFVQCVSSAWFVALSAACNPAVFSCSCRPQGAVSLFLLASAVPSSQANGHCASRLTCSALSESSPFASQGLSLRPSDRGSAPEPEGFVIAFGCQEKHNSQFESDGIIPASYTCLKRPFWAFTSPQRHPVGDA